VNFNNSQSCNPARCWDAAGCAGLLPAPRPPEWLDRVSCRWYAARVV